MTIGVDVTVGVVVNVIAIMVVVEQKSVMGKICSTVTNCSLKVGCAYQKLNQHLGKHRIPEAE